MADVTERLAAAGQPHLVDRLLHLDALDRAAPLPPPPPTPRRDDARDFDIVIAGGGLSLLFAAPLARRGWRVAVCDRHGVGRAQREWNASMGELMALCEAGCVTPEELTQLVVARYRDGICRWHRGGTQHVRGVLDCAVDATALLELARRRALEAGVQLLDGASLSACAASDYGVRAWLHEGERKRPLTAGILIDARGAASPYATGDLVCPTVGGVLQGLTEGDAVDCVDPEVGEILVTTEGMEDGRQHLWEVFPGRRGEVAVYLFYYTERRRLRPGALQALYRRFFARLPAFKQGAATLVRPTFGFIPGWSRLAPAPTSPHPRVVLVGDAAARHSPLTFCGFGAMLRSLPSVVAAVHEGAADCGVPAVAVDDRALHGVTGALALVMARANPQKPHALNALLAAAFSSLEAMGNDAFAALLQDRLPLRDFVTFLRTTSRLHPQVYDTVWHGLGAGAASRWAYLLARGALGERSAVDAAAAASPAH